MTERDDDMTRIQGELQSLFDTRSLGEPKHLLGIEINRNYKDRTISLRQTSYIDAMLKRFGLENCNPVLTPMDPHVVIKNRTSPPANISLYQQLLGSLLYAAMCTRPDIAYAIHALSQYSVDPGEEHWTAAKRVLRYLKGTRDLALTYGGPEDWDDVLESYSDADWASNDDRKSISGFTFLLGGGAVSWSAKKQPIIALSSTESEYIAATHSSRHLIWLRSLLAELGHDQPSPSLLYMDNQSAMALAQDDQFHPRTKHIDIRYHFIRYLIKSGAIALVYCPTQDMIADIMTKGLARPLNDKHRTGLGVIAA